jgi:hypothetical protein
MTKGKAMSKVSANFTTSDACEVEAIRLTKTDTSKVFYCNYKPNTMQPGVDKVYTFWVSDTYGMWTYCGFTRVNGRLETVDLPEGDE